MIGGILLGPTLLGALAPSFYNWLFGPSDNLAVAQQAIVKIGMLFFMFIAGLEVDLSSFRQAGNRAASIGLLGTLLPIAVGVLLVYSLPARFWGPASQTHFFAFALFIGMNLANSANPVIARILMDLGLMQTQVGKVIMSATIVDDLVNWVLFAVVINEIAPSGAPQKSFLLSILWVVLFSGTILFIGRKYGERVLQWLRRRLVWPGGFITVTSVLVLVAGGIAEALGVHAFLGAFLVGAALGGRDQERNTAHQVISQFVTSFFVPIYFVTLGLTTNFSKNFDLLLVGILLAAAIISKTGSVLLGARLAGMPIHREAWAIAFGLNARGATGIILAGIGLEYQLIDERIFVALVFVALVTSLISAPAMNLLLGDKASLRIPS